MAQLIGSDGKSMDFYEPKAGVFIPKHCNAAYFGGSPFEVIVITAQQAQELCDKWFPKEKKDE